MLLGYNTNGLCHHDLVDAVELLAEIGYRSVAITLDRESLLPHGGRYAERLPRALLDHGLRSVVETGGRFLLDRNFKHEPTLMTASVAGRQKRIDFYKHAIELASAWQSDAVSLWSGTLRDDVSDDAAFARLVEGLKPVLEHADRHDMTIAFEPEPGMFIDTMARFDQLVEMVAAPHFKLTLDVGHLHCLGETPIAAYIRRYADQIVNVHIEDMRRGIHEHMPFGEGEMNFAPILQAFRDIHYPGGLHVELSRHSHDGPAMAKRAWEFLSGIG